MPKAITLSNGRTWDTQGKALAHFKEMLARYSDGSTVEDRADHDDLIALVERYDEAITNAPSKTGSGIELFMRRRNSGVGYSTSGFWLRRVDGTETDFSYISAVKGEPKSDAQQFHDACRAAVAQELVAAKKRHFAKYGDSLGRIACDITDELVAYDEAHMDHAYPTFGQLVQSFRAARGWQHDVPSGTLTTPADGQTTTTFIDPQVADAFRQFHKGAAMLRVVSKSQNLSMASGQRKPKIKRPVEL